MNKEQQQLHEQHGTMPMMSWGKFAAMIAVATILMFPLMYQLVYSSDHLMYSNNRLLSALVMGSLMAFLMVAFMWSMFKPQGAKVAVLVGSLILFAALLLLNRSEALNGDVGFMSSMIPHHSIAINNAEKAKITDPRVRKLADEIISSQVREITEMKLLIADIQKNGSRGKTVLQPIPATVTPDMQPKIEEAVK